MERGPDEALCLARPKRQLKRRALLARYSNTQRNPRGSLQSPQPGWPRMPQQRWCRTASRRPEQVAASRLSTAWRHGRGGPRSSRHQHQRRPRSRDHWNLGAKEFVRVSSPVDTLVVVADDCRDRGIVIDLFENSLPNLTGSFPLRAVPEGRVGLSFRGGPAGAHLANIVNETAKMGELLLSRRKTHSLCDVPRVEGHCC